jgi:hypothetical protein
MKETAFRCHINASIALGVEELNYGTVDTTKSLIIREAKVGDSDAINILMKMYNMRNEQKEELEHTLRESRNALEEVKSGDREFAKGFFEFHVKAGCPKV